MYFLFQDGDACPVCFEDMNENNKTSLDCGHEFHELVSSMHCFVNADTPLSILKHFITNFLSISVIAVSYIYSLFFVFPVH